MEAPVFLLFCLAIGYLLYWTVVNDKRDPNGGCDGWFSIKPVDANSTPAHENQQHTGPLSRH
jgi:hypothetical protein